ncbi:indole-3-glycerol-phosphate synthase [Halovibrio salipaludis]|uniref:Indole-3-glycerol phosphate synthase n=1 Tax=Halovibrio salipaludis TaxID=2032626 RepID=A0A2A2F9W1_9GAMM|nr:indole-3-glycerol phosphate synthase TrpC [Halovibrio salipaludis]PAU81738.1 indole-3-glycerol-phosphate synthase [Halovibrio salipaludis]
MNDDTPTVLKRIVARKHEEVAERQRRLSLEDCRTEARAQPATRGFAAALQRRIDAGDPAVIAEIKRASPSAGVLRDPYDPAAIARDYEAHGAACLSVLTDRDFFQGGEADLMAAREACSLPALRKDFMVDEYQIHESRIAGADCILLIAACLSVTQMQALAGTARELGMDVLVEVHNEAELEQALQVDSPLLGINNRDLHTFEVSLDTTRQLHQRVPTDRLTVTESGIHTPEDVAAMRERGIHAFLVGESFMRAGSPGYRLGELFFQKV